MSTKTVTIKFNVSLSKSLADIEKEFDEVLIESLTRYSDGRGEFFAEMMCHSVSELVKQTAFMAALRHATSQGKTEMVQTGENSFTSESMIEAGKFIKDFDVYNVYIGDEDE
jgi:hypothetical protein